MTAGAVLLISACSGPSLPELPLPSGIPTSWVQRTSDGWPQSDGYGSQIPVLESGSCLLADSPPEILGVTAEVTTVGWGPYGDDSDGGPDDPAYRYICDFWAEDAYAGELQLIRARSTAEAQRTVDAFLEQPSTTQQDNTVQTVRAGGQDVHVLSRWYPTNPQGLYQAMVFDQAAAVLVVLEVNSLDRDQYAQTTPQQIADALVASFA